MSRTFRLASVALALALGVSPFAAQSQGKSNSVNNAATTMTTNMGAFPLVAWSWGASQSGAVHGGGGGGAGKANFQDLSITRYADGQSPHFLTMLATGQVISAVQLDRGAVRIVLKDVLVTSFSTGGSFQERTEMLTENITLNFARIEFSVNGQSFCFDAVNNTGC